MDGGCLARRYMGRIEELARSTVDRNGVTGQYSYQNAGEPEDSNRGNAFIAMEPDQTLAAAIRTLQGPGYNSCWVDIRGAERMGDTWLWMGKKEQAEFGGGICRILLRQSGNSLRIDSLNCGYFCGHNAAVDDTYLRKK